MTIDPSKDGIDHINVYSKGATALGRFLSNFSHSPINTIDGRFQSIEGYWYWLGCTHPDRDKLRSLSGFLAKKVGRELKAKDWQNTEDFKSRICLAIATKVLGNDRMCTELRQSTLPLRHYYVFGGKVIEPTDGEWIIEFLDSFRGTR